jgi:hypothetical protein
MVTWKFRGILILCVGGERRLAKPLTDIQLAFLAALQVPPAIPAAKISVVKTVGWS